MTVSQATSTLSFAKGAPCWMDLMSSDQDKSAAFYSEVFGWVAQDSPPEMQGYKYFELNGKAVGGCMKNEPEWGAADGWSVLLQSDDVRATAAAARDSGGEVLMEPMDIEPNGSFVVLKDCGGASISAWQAGSEPGFAIRGEPGAPVHFELHTRSFDKSVDFYRNVFGWDAKVVSDTPEFRYALSSNNEADAWAGVMDATAFLSKDQSPHWSVYLGAADIDKTLERVSAAGGSVRSEPADTPYGRLAVVADSGGVVFKLQG